MKRKKQNAFLLRIVVIIGFLSSFIYIFFMFFTQYEKYIKSRDVLEEAYHTNKHKSELLFAIFQDYSDAENLFNLYSIDYNTQHFENYKLKLDTIKTQLDSLSKIIDEKYSVDESLLALENKDRSAREFVSIKKNIDDLIIHAEIKLPEIKNFINSRTQSKTQFRTDSLIGQLLADTTLTHMDQDTVVSQRQNLFNRIFNAKTDTLVAHSITQQINQKWVEVVENQVSHFIENYQIHHDRDLRNIQNSFLNYRKKERELIHYNDILLQHLKFGLDNLNRLEMESIQISEKMALEIHENNAKLYSQQLRNALIVMLLMILLIIYFHRNATRYELKLERERNYANKLAEEKTSILASISHEIRSPINSLKGTLEIIKKEQRNNALTPELLDSVSHEVHVINNTINDILNLSKIEAGDLEIKYADFHVQNLLLEIINLHTYEANKKELTLLHDIQISDEVILHSSPFRLKQIITNLLGNAIKYTQKGQVKLVAKMQLNEKQNYLEIQVIDTGIGIAENHQKDIFRQYYMANSNATNSSFGLGLYISKLLTEQLKGSIHLKSKVGEGTVFQLKIPVIVKSLDKNEMSAISEQIKSWNILIIDDNPVNLIHMEHTLKSEGFSSIETCQNSEEAVDKIKTNSYQLILTDLLMPEIPGWELLKITKERKLSTYVFAVTSDPDIAAKHAFDGVLSKPFKAQELKNAVYEIHSKS